ncbi:MAG: hypothetical protein QOI10_877 [Solirubrobacterales bacterium]|jgi:hypothetical protein|nr:hypothetical protein [Solirubrobacterales bacterium]
MSDEPDVESPQGGVFGNLPGSRPGTRSPRRDGAGKPRKAPAKATKASARTASAEPASPPPKPPGERPEPPATEAPSGGGIEDLAWAGVAAAAEAATLGVRLASRAIEALRGNSESS